MDVSAWITPGAQELAAKMMDQGWSAIRDAIARRIGRSGKGAVAEEAATTVAATSLDAIRAKALTADPGSQQEILLAYCAGYLDALATTRPDLADLAQGLQVEQPDAGQGASGNLSTGRAKNVIQVGRDVTGGMSVK